MALPVVDISQPGVKELIQGSVKDIANTIFATASVSITAAAKAVTPSIPQMVADITDDLRAGPVNRFSQGLEKLDKLLQNFGGDIKDYSKELAKFVSQREDRINKSEKIVSELRENNVKAQVTNMGEVLILSQTQIAQKEKELIQTNETIKLEKEKIAANAKLVQEEGGNTKKRRKVIIESQEKIIKKERERTALLKVLNKKERDMVDKEGESMRDRVSNFVDKYIPQGLQDVANTFIDTLMSPITAITELGSYFMDLLKPLRFLLKPLMALGKHFKKLGLLLFGFIKKAAVLFKSFILGMIGAIVSMLPFIAIGIAIVAAIGLMIAGFVKLLQIVEENKESLMRFKDRIMEIPGQIKDFLSEKFEAIGLAFDSFVEKVKAIPSKISEFFKGVFNRIQNFFIDMINGAIGLINKVLPKKYELETIENVPMPASEPAEIVPAESKGTVAAAQNGTGTATSSVPPFLNTSNSQSSTNNAAAVINNNAVNNNTTNSIAASAKNNDYSRMSLYGDMSA